MKKLGQIKTKYILWFFVVLIFTVPLTIYFPLPLAISDRVRVAYHSIQNIPNGSTVLALIGAYGPGTTRILMGYGVDVVVKQLITKDIKIVFANEWIAANTAWLITQLDTVINWQARGYVYGEDYVFLPFTPGGEMYLSALKTDFQGIHSVDYFSTPISDLPIVADITGESDFSAIIATGFAPDQIGQQIRQLGATSTRPFIGIIDPSMISEYLPFYKPGGAVTSAFGGSSEAAQYEFLSGIGGPSGALVNVTSLGMLFTFFMILGVNIYGITQIRKEKMKEVQK